jgi:hypothetical protein
MPPAATDKQRMVSISMKHFFHTAPDLAFGLCIRQGDLRRVGLFPPLLSGEVGSHFFHIGVKIITGIFKVTKQVRLAVYLFQVDGVVTDVALRYFFLNSRPGVCV